MININAKFKIFVAGVVWILLCLSMPLYFFKILDSSNQALIAKIDVQKKELLALNNEQQSYKKAEQDLEDFSRKPYQPEKFFSNEINVVEELKILESLGPKLGINVTMSGLSGTIESAPKAAVKGDIVQLPYSFTATGPFLQVLQYVEILENLDFVIHSNSVSVSPANDGNINLALSSFLYLKRK